MSNRVNLKLDVTKTDIQNPLIKVRQGDGGFETLRTTVTSNGEPLDLQGWTITFMGTTAGNHKIVDGNVKLVEAPNGIFEYTPSKAWGIDIGEFKIAYFKFVKGDGSASSANFRVSVIEAVDLTQEEAQNYISVVDDAIAEAREHLENSLADVSLSVAATSSAASSMAIFVSSTASSAVSQANSAAFNASSVASSAVNAVSAASNTYVKDTRLASGVTDFNLVMGKTWSGKWYKVGEHWSNEPEGTSQYLNFEYTPGDSERSGILELQDWTKNRHFVRTLSAGVWSNWVELADNAAVVHNTGNETIAGNKTFTSPIVGSLATRLATFTDFNDVSKNISAYNGNWFVGGTSVANDPIGGTMQWYHVYITASGKSGSIMISTISNNQTYIATSTDGKIVSWKLIADDATVAHNTGNETIAGNKAFTNNVNIGGTLNSSKQYLEIGSRVKSADKSGLTTMWFGWQVYWTIRNGYATYQIQPTSTETITSGTKSTEKLPVEACPLYKVFVPLRWGGQGFSINTDGTFENDTGVNIVPNASWSTAVSATLQGW